MVLILILNSVLVKITLILVYKNQGYLKYIYIYIYIYIWKVYKYILQIERLKRKTKDADRLQVTK